MCIHILQTISKLEGINVAKSELYITINNQFNNAEYLSAKMKCIAKARFFPLFGGQCFHWFEVEIVIKMQIVEIFPMN